MKYLILFSFVLFGCNVKHHKKKSKIVCYKTHNTKTSDPDDFMYWYVINTSDGGCYYTTSTTRVNNFNTVTWYSSPSKLSELKEEEIVEEIQEPIEELPEEMESEVSESEESAAEGEAGDSDGGGDSGGDGGGDGGGGDGGGGD